MVTMKLTEAYKGMTAATVRRWLVQPGQAVAAGQPVVELEVEEAIVRVTAPSAGVLGAVAAGVGTTVPVGGELGSIAAGGAPADAQTSETAPLRSRLVQTSSNASTQGSVMSNATPILMPQAGNTMEEGRILSWKVKAGDVIAVGQVICEIETDKATMEFESPVAGKISKIVVPEGEVAPVKTPIAFVGEGAVEVSATSSPVAPAASAPPAPPAPPATTSSAAQGAGSATPILMPQAGNTMEEGRILSWKVKAGDVIAVGQVICDIETDKATMEFESPVAGKLAKIVVPEGEAAAVKTPIAFVGDGVIAVGNAPASSTPSSSNAPAAAITTQATPVAASAQPVAQRPSSGAQQYPASPAARKLAAQQGLDLASVGQGSGPGGRILSTDLSRATKAGSAGGTGVPPVQGGITRKPMSKMRKAIALNLQQSKQTVPHFYVRLTIDAGPLFAFYKDQKPKTNCSINDVVVMSLAKAMKDFPALRSRLDGDTIVEHANANIGIAVGIDDGLVVPVVMGVDQRSLSDLAAETKRVVENARKGKLENIGKATFTISNLGMFGVEEFSAIINPPESGILAVSAVRESVIVKEGAMKAGRVMTMTLSADHRIVDGLLAAQFMARFKEILENPASL